MRHLDVTSGKYVELTAMRARLLKAARDWFDAHSFTEVPCPHITGATGSCEWFPNAMPVTMYDLEGDEKDMFLRQTAQLYLEGFTHAHNRVYTIGPSFRQERRATNRHLCEFTLIELEGRDFELPGLLEHIEGVVKAMFEAAIDYGSQEILSKFINSPFNQIRYSEALELLRGVGHEIDNGDDFNPEQELKICELLGGLPTFVTHFPAILDPSRPGQAIKFFSMKRDVEADETICADLLLPEVGEAVGSAVREGDPEVCKSQFEASIMHRHMVERGVDPNQFSWYFEVLGKSNGKYPYPQSSGCGIGFERVVQCVLATNGERQSIKNAVEIPRAPDFLMI
ncbi:MAG: amino acid--tRNA ligase-related protein [Candidatus Zixiibacteriota bacterium]